MRNPVDLFISAKGLESVKNYHFEKWLVFLFKVVSSSMLMRLISTQNHSKRRY